MHVLLKRIPIPYIFAPHYYIRNPLPYPVAWQQAVM